MKYLISILVAALLGALLYGWDARNTGILAQQEAAEYQRSLIASEASVEALVASAENDRKVLTARAVYAEALALKRKKDNANLQEALSANRAWSDTPIPDSVLDAINRSDQGSKGDAP